jgi:PAS domain-containing protein
MILEAIIFNGLMEGHRWNVFENRALRRIFGYKREEVAGGWRRLHNEELHNVFCSPNVNRVAESGRMIARHVARTGEMRKAYKILVG